MSPSPLRSIRRSLPALVLAASLSLPGLAAAQSQDVVLEVQRLAPQLVTFAGSLANFQNLAAGLALGLPVRLTGATSDGFQQTATFTPAGPLSAVQVAQTLELARQSLISRGIATPTPEQIGVALLGGQLPTPVGRTLVAGVLGGAGTTAGTAANATAASPSAGASAPSAPASAAPSLQLDVRPLAQTPPATPLGAVPAPTMTSASPQVRNTSDSILPRNTSDSPFTRNTSDSPVPAAVPLPGTVTPAANGAVAPGAGASQPSPAAQMQGRR
jgi:hypothetical protein